MALLKSLSGMAQKYSVLAVPFSSRSFKVIGKDTEKNVQGIVLHLISYDNKTGSSTFYFFGFTFADLLINLRMSGNSTYCTPTRIYSALGQWPSCPNPFLPHSNSPPSHSQYNVRGGYARMAKGRKDLWMALMFRYHLYREAKERFCLRFFRTFEEQ